MALWKRAGTCFVKLESPDGMLLGRSAGATDTQKAQEYHDRLKAELWDLAYLKRTPERTWDEAAFHGLRQLRVALTSAARSARNPAFPSSP
jgi:hypothetical protein